MKKISTFLSYFTLALLLAVSCGKSSDEKNEGSIISTEEHGNISISYLAVKESSLIEFAPTAIMSCGQDLFVRFYNPDNPDSEDFLYVNGNSLDTHGLPQSVYLHCKNGRILCRTMEGKALFLSSENDYSILYLGESSGGNGLYLTAQIPILTKISSKGSFENNIKATFKNFYRSLYNAGENGDYIDAAVGSEFPSGKLFSLITRFGGSVGGLVMAESEEEADQIREQYYSDTISDLIWDIVTYPIKSVQSGALFKILGKSLINILPEDYPFESVFGIPRDGLNEDFFFDVGLVYSSDTFNSASCAKADLFDSFNVEELDNPYSLVVSYNSVTETSARLRGSCTYEGNSQMGWAINEQGFCYSKYGSSEWTYIPSTNMSPKTLTLEPATKYYVASYVTSFMGTTYRSEHKTLITKGFRIAISPDNINVDPDGGQYRSTVSGGDEVKVKIIGNSMPSCKAECSNSVLSSIATIVCTVGKTNKSREGDIQIQFTNHYLEQTTGSIHLNQNVATSSWNNTSWKGVIHWDKPNFAPDDEISPVIYEQIKNMTLEFNFKNISEGYTEPNNDAVNHYYVDKDGNAVIRTTGEDLTIEFILTRKSETSANLKGYVNNFGFIFNGTGTATRK